MQKICKIQFASIATLFFWISISACNKYVEVSTPPTSISVANVYTSDATAISAVTNMYATMSGSNFSTGGITSISLFACLSADEFTLYPGTTNYSTNFYYTNELSRSNLNNPDFWTAYYQMIYLANSAIEGLTNNTSLTLSVQKQLLGEAEFMRAFCYFYLINLYGDVPFVTSTNFNINALLTRTDKNTVWSQVISDLKNAQNLLSTSYLDATLLNTTTERVRPTQWSADALLARVYLYTAKYDSAELMATAVINNGSLFGLDSLNSVFLMNSTEAIWQLQPIIVGQNTPDAWLFILPQSGPDPYSWPVYLSPFLLNSFEANDQRRYNWIDSVNVNGTLYYYPYKYKSATLGAPLTEYEMVFRLAEQYLIRAETEANGAGTGINGAINDLNTIRTRADLPNYNGPTDRASVLSAIFHERQVELFTEWGHRWLDLKRSGTVDAVMGTGGVCTAKGGAWNTDWQWYPIELSELKADPNLVQNPGY